MDDANPYTPPGASEVAQRQREGPEHEVSDPRYAAAARRWIWAAALVQLLTGVLLLTAPPSTTTLIGISHLVAAAVSIGSGQWGIATQVSATWRASILATALCSVILIAQWGHVLLSYQFGGVLFLSINLAVPLGPPLAGAGAAALCHWNARNL